MEPYDEPRLDVRGHLVDQRDADRREEAADDDPRDALRRHVEHTHEQAEEEDGRAEVALHDEDPHADGPGREDGDEVTRQGQAHPQEFRPRQGKVVPLRDEVSGEEDGEADLRELGGLEGETHQADPDARAVDRPAQPRDHGQEQKPD